MVIGQFGEFTATHFHTDGSLIGVNEDGTMTELITASESAGAERFEVFRHAVSEQCMPVAITTYDLAAFRGRVQSASLGTVQLVDVAVTSKRAGIIRNVIPRSTAEYLKVGLQMRGRCVLSQDGREAALAPGDFAVRDPARPYQLAVSDTFRMLVVLFPRKLLRLPPARLAQLTGRRVSGRQGLGALVSPFLAGLGGRLDAGNLTGGIPLSDAILDMFAASFAEQLACETAVGPEARRRVLLLRIQAFLEDRLDDPGLDLAAVAAAHHISVRYLQKLFEEQGETVTGWIRARPGDRRRARQRELALGVPGERAGGRGGAAGEPSCAARRATHQRD